jgi:hypothetical protein
MEIFQYSSNREPPKTVKRQTIVGPDNFYDAMGCSFESRVLHEGNYSDKGVSRCDGNQRRVVETRTYKQASDIPIFISSVGDPEWILDPVDDIDQLPARRTSRRMRTVQIVEKKEIGKPVEFVHAVDVIQPFAFAIFTCPG